MVSWAPGLPAGGLIEFCPALVPLVAAFCCCCLLTFHSQAILLVAFLGLGYQQALALGPQAVVFLVQGLPAVGRELKVVAALVRGRQVGAF